MNGVPTHQVTLEWDENRSVTVQVSESETVLDAAETAGIKVPYGCLTGACGTCTGRILAADGVTPTDVIDHERPPRALKERHLANGYVLLCIGRPRADCRIAVGKDVQAELVENPWK